MEITLKISTPDNRHRPSAYMQQATKEYLERELWKRTDITRFYIQDSSFGDVSYTVDIVER